MQNKAFVPGRAIHMIYGLIIAGLSAFVFYQQRLLKAERQLGPVADLTLEPALGVIERSNRQMYEALRMMLDAYPIPAHKEMSNQTRAIRRIEEGFERTAGILRNQVSASSPSWKVQLKVAYNLYKDSLILIKTRDELYKLPLQKLFSRSDSTLEALLLVPVGNKENSRRMIDLFILRVNAEVNFSYNYLAEQITSLDIKLDPGEPVMEVKRIGQKPGEVFEAEVFLSYRAKETKEIIIEVNGEKLPVNMGKATILRQYDQPGTYPLKISIRQTDPWTRDQRVYEKEFVLCVPGGAVSR